MKRNVLFLFFLIVLCNSAAICDEIKIDQWSPMSAASVSPSSNGNIKVSSSGELPLIVSKNDLFISAGKTSFLRIDMRSSNPYTTGRMFFKRIGDKDFMMANSYEFTTGRGNAMRGYVLDLDRNPNWMGVVTQIIFSPMNSQGTSEINSFRFLEPSFMLSVKAYWQQFMQFEPYVPRSVNFIYGPKLGDVSINLYIYYAVLMFAAFFLLYGFARTRNIKTVLISFSKMTLIIMIAVWILLDLRLFVDNIRSVSVDQMTFDGQSLDAKRSLIAQKEYYDFITFCSSKVPSGSAVDIIFPDQIYYLKEKAKYYMYPTYISDSPQYVLVFDPSNNISAKIHEVASKGFRPFATFKEREFILKK